MNTKQVIVVRKDLKMNRGKMAAQVAHASMLWLISRIRKYYDDPIHSLLNSDEEWDWVKNSFAKVVLWCENEEEFHTIAEQAKAAGLTVHKIQDEARTTFTKPTWTTLAIGPDECDMINTITGHLQLAR